MSGHWVHSVVAAAPPADGEILRLVDGPCLSRRHVAHAVPVQSQRLVVLTALRLGRTDRRRAAALLWPDCDAERAGGNLRSALWRLHGARLDVVCADKSAPWLHPEVTVDLAVVRSRAK